jgi:Secretion system C-terminal sorting domain
MPGEFALHQNYPNPFNPVTTIQFSIVNPRLPYGSQQGGQAQFTILRVYDILGREVANLVNEVKQPGVHTVRWEARGVASGVYFCRLEARPLSGGQAGYRVASNKILLLR